MILVSEPGRFFAIVHPIVQNRLDRIFTEITRRQVFCGEASFCFARDTVSKCASLQVFRSNGVERRRSSRHIGLCSVRYCRFCAHSRLPYPHKHAIYVAAKFADACMLAPPAYITASTISFAVCFAAVLTPTSGLASVFYFRFAVTSTQITGSADQRQRTNAAGGGSVSRRTGAPGSADRLFRLFAAMILDAAIQVTAAFALISS